MKVYSVLLVSIVAFLTGSSLAQEQEAPEKPICDCSQECYAIASARALSVEKSVTQTFESRIRELEEQLSQSQQQATTLENQVKESEAEIARLNSEKSQSQTSVEEALAQAQAKVTETEKALEESQQSLAAALKREATFRNEAEDSLSSLHAEIQDLQQHKIKASELQSHVEALQKDLNEYKEEMQSSKEQLTRELDIHKKQVLEKDEELTMTRERLRELDDLAGKTYVNTTLIIRDASYYADKAMTKMGEVWDLFVETTIVVLEKMVDLYNTHVAPKVDQALDVIHDLYKRHAKATVDNDILPALKPVLDPAGEILHKAHVAVSAALASGCDSLKVYLELSVETKKDEPSATRKWFIQALDFCSKNSEDVVKRVTYGILIYILLSFVWRRGGKTVPPPAGEPKQSAGSTPAKRKGPKLKSQ
jgi:myosin heavy subunit